MIRRLEGERPAFVLDTPNTTYVISLSPSGHVEHLYYGVHIDITDAAQCEVFREKREFEPGNVITYSHEFNAVVLEDMCLEMSSGGHGDIRESFIELVRENGARSSDFKFASFTITDSRTPLRTLPCAYSEDGRIEHLCLTLTDGDLVLELHYCVFPDCDVITRSAKLINKGQSSVAIERLLSAQIDIPFGGTMVTSFHGSWAHEMNKNTAMLTAGKFVIESRAGCSSSRANPFFMVHQPDTSENIGSVYGFNLIYSGNHYAAVEVNAFGKTRIVNGIQPEGFRFILQKGGMFETPESVMTFSNKGFSGQSVNMHKFVREHIVRGKWKRQPRPILLNSWEACYFNISESTLLDLASIGKDIGIEMLVMDDGWFGERNDEEHSLGDWDANPKKLPHGLKGLGDKLAAKGVKFGIWVEPEMFNRHSKLYEQHPEWSIAIPGAHQSEGRKQRILDLANPVVVQFVTEKMTEVFSSAKIDYVKWDMNRIFSDVYSQYLPPEQQGETAHRYICGIYQIMAELTKRFPDILFEGCASGGNRFDLGILCYFPQIWASDNTDALSRANIQEGYSYGYPQSTYTAHVAASPNHQTLRQTSPETRFGVASFGVLGYECDVRDLSGEMKKKLAAQTALYKKLREVLQFGQFYRVRTGNVHEWICVSQDKKQAVGMMLQELVQPNTQAERFYAKGLDPEREYRFYNVSQRVDIKQFGSLVNTIAPFHIKQDSMVHNIVARTVKMNGEAEDVTAPGAVLMSTGVALKPAFSGTGFNENVRVFPDFSLRMYFIESK